MVMSEGKLIDEMLDMAAKDIAKQIDKELLDTIMIDVLTKEGWAVTSMNPAFGKGSIGTEIDWYTETAEWIHINATGDYKLLLGQWLFEKKEDAVMFTLKWS
jgi:hypothetical protein